MSYIRTILFTIASKINATPKGVNKCYLYPHYRATLDFSRSEFISRNNISQICYCSQILLQSAAVNCTFSVDLKPLE